MSENKICKCYTVDDCVNDVKIFSFFFNTVNPLVGTRTYHLD